MHPQGIQSGKSSYLVSDLICCLDMPAIVVSRPGLGTINHTLLTTDHAEKKGIRVLAVVINGYPERPGICEKNNPKMISAITGLPVITLPFVKCEEGDIPERLAESDHFLRLLSEFELS